MTTVVRNGDLISHRTHKHEQPVTSRPIRIVHEDEDLIVVDKPSGIPVHPTGRFRFNSVVMVLKHEQNKVAHRMYLGWRSCNRSANLACNRLDRLTSGLFFLAKTAKGAEKMSAQLRGREVRKQYLARVVGEFPLGDVVCDQPLMTVDPKVALNRVVSDGKEARTGFNRISFDGQTSIVRCKPLTGRTHQIRVHLQYLGHPIANDPIYSNPNVWGPQLGKGGAGNTDEITAKLHGIGKTQIAETYIHPKNNDGEKLTGEKCADCHTELYTDPGENDLDLWLHALKYYAEDESWGYETPMPEWVTEVHLPYMQMALEQAKKCGPTETAFSVGAVLVKDGKVLETGYSRELPGNTHAEQCALEKYFTKHGVRDVPVGTVIYTTMEPCSERLSGNLPCVDRILGTTIKTVFVGVVEPETFVKENTGRSKLAAQGVEYILIPGFEQECLIAAKKGHPQSLPVG
jgi:tRNA pseudouridine synthase 8/2,5-diamino-6-(5-phospho-D-ribitylamino)-pyrimidin-4(3H)-one deaminase